MRTFLKISILFTVLLCIISCDRGETTMLNNSIDQDIEIKQISISCASPFQKVLLNWVVDFNNTHPNIQVSIQDSNFDFLLISENLLFELNDEESWRIPVMREGIIPVISENNPFLSILEQQGISKDDLIKIFTGEHLSWGEILGNDAEEKVVVFLPERGKGYNTKWAGFLELNPELLQGKRFSNMEILLDSIRQSPFIIAVLNACCAYNPETNERVDGIRALYMDVNNDGRIDRKEEIADDLCELERAVFLGLIPPELCNCIFLQAEQAPVNREQIVFIKWILTEGQKHVVDYGYSVVRHSTTTKVMQELEAI